MTLRLAVLPLLFALPAVAQDQMPPADELAALALETCVRQGPPQEDEINTGPFVLTATEGEMKMYEHPAGPLLTIVSGEDHFSCELTVEDGTQEQLDALLADLGPAMADRFGAEPTETETGTTWESASEGMGILARADLDAEGTLSFTWATGPEALEPAQDN